MRYFVNVTTSLNWCRPPVGIVRVEVEVTRFLLSYYHSEITLCAWNKEHKKFFGVDRRHYLAHLKSLEANSPLVKPLLENECFFRPHDILLSMGLDWDLCFTQDLIRLKKKHQIAVIACCYDIIPILFPHYCVGDVSRFFGEYFLDLASLADHILCISKSSERDLLGFLAESGLSRLPSTSVFELGDTVLTKANHHSSNGYLNRESMGIERDYALLVSTIERRKNHHLVYLAYRKIIAEELVSDDKLPMLVFVGMKGWGIDELLKDIELDPVVSGRILILDHVSDQELALLYKECLFTLYPSFYEGWGLPVAESLCYGKPVVCSGSSSLPEVGGDLAIYADPYSATDYAQKIAALCNNREELDSKSHQIKLKYKPRSWLATGREVAREIDVVATAINASTFSLQLQCGHEMSSYGGVYNGPNLVIPRETMGLAMFGPHISVPPGNLFVELILSLADTRGVKGVSKLVADGYIMQTNNLPDLLESSKEIPSNDGNRRYLLRFPSCTLDVFCHALELIVEIESLNVDLQFEMVSIQVIGPFEQLSSNITQDSSLPPIARANRCIRQSRHEQALIILNASQDKIPRSLYEAKLQEIQMHLGAN